MKSMLFRLFSAILLGGLILNSCQNDEKLLLTNDLHEGLIDTKVLKSATESQGCIDPGNGVYGFDALGFSAIPGGWRNEIGGFGNLGHEAHYWSCTDANHFDGVYYHSFAFGIRVSQEDFYMFDEIQPIAMGVRCVRDR